MWKFALLGALLLSPVLAYAVGVAAAIDTNGVLEGYVVQRNGETICENPTVWNDFRNGRGYIVCD